MGTAAFFFFYWKMRFDALGMAKFGHENSALGMGSGQNLGW